MSNGVKMVRCKVCGMNTRHLCDTANEHGEISVIRNFRCVNCGLVFVGNEITNDQLGTAYATMDSERYYAEVGKTEERKFATSLTNLRSCGVKETSRLIDIGTGNGAFLLYLKNKGFQHLSGHDIPGAGTKELDDNHIPVYKDYDYTAIPDASFDVATLLDVMEHVSDPHHVAESVYRILKPGGILYFHTPCVTVTDRLMHGVQRIPLIGKIGRIWQRGRTSVFHLQNYTCKSVEIILQKANYGNISIKRVNELSWPLRRYIRVYLCEKLGLPEFLSYLAIPFFYPFLATSFFNANKAVVVAKKPVSGETLRTPQGISRI